MAKKQGTGCSGPPRALRGAAPRRHRASEQVLAHPARICREGDCPRTALQESGYHRPLPQGEGDPLGPHREVLILFMQCAGAVLQAPHPAHRPVGLNHYDARLPKCDLRHSATRCRVASPKRRNSVAKALATAGRLSDEDSTATTFHRSLVRSNRASVLRRPSLNDSVGRSRPARLTMN